MTHILFVDDEAEILDGLRNRLWRKRRDWHLSFALGGQAAIDLVAHEEFDIVICDVRMPSIDGVAVLERVRRDQPTAVRILLSGETGVNVSRHLHVAQQILGKPCPIELIEETIDRAQRVRAVISDLKIQRRVGELIVIPSVPELVGELDDILFNPNRSLAEAEAIISRDPGLAARVLQIANSGALGSRRVIHSIEDAVSLLGLEALKAIAMLHEVRSSVLTRDRGAHDRLVALQRNSLAVARIASRLFEDLRLRRSAFTAGLLHDIGTMLLDPTLSDQAPRARGEDDDPPHHAVGAYAVAIWGLPYALVEAVLFQHEPWLATPARFDLPGVIYVASRLAAEAWPDLRPCAAERKPLDLDFLERSGVVARLPEWRAMAEELALEQGRAA